MRRLLPPVALTLVSAASMAVEIVAARALAPYVGMSLYSWTIIIAVVLAGLSVGHWIGGVIADRAAALHRIVALSLFGAAATVFASLWLLRLIAPATEGLDPVAHAGALTLAAFLAPSLIAGVVSPLLTTIALRQSDEAHAGRVLGLMYALGAFGAIIGTLAAGLVLVSWLGTAASLMAIALAYGALGALFLRRMAGAAALAAVAMTGGGAFLAPDALLARAACDRETAYYCIRIDDLTFLGRSARVMALDHLAHGVNDRDDPMALLAPYVHGVDELVADRFQGAALSAFFVGGGAYSLPRAWLDRYPEARLTVAEIDPEVTQAAHERLWLPRDPRLTVLAEDARVALTGLPDTARFDVIFGDAFHDISIPQHLVTDEFHAEVARRLTHGGIYALNVVDSLREPIFVLSLAATLEQRFAHVQLWLDVEELLSLDRRTTWIVMASQAPMRTVEKRSTYGFRRTWVEAPIADLAVYVGRERLERLTDDFAPVDRLLSGVLLHAETVEN